MLINYFKIAFRNLKKHKLFSLVNIAGLALGLAAFWMIILFVADELSYDRYHKNADRIFRVVHSATWDGGHFNLAPTAVPFGPALKNDYPEIESFARIDQEGGGVLQFGDKQIKAEDIFFADSSMFSMFSYRFLLGDPTNALTKPQSIVLTKSLAIALFGSPEEAMGKMLSIDNRQNNQVTAVIGEIPANSHLHFRALRSFPTNYTDGWHNFYVYTYVMLHNSDDLKRVQNQLSSFYDKYLKREGEKIDYQMQLQPLTSIHLRSDLDYEIAVTGKIRTVYIFSVIAILILVIASINYMNLSTARSSVRVKEIGVRKVMGSGIGQLTRMFLAESVLFTLIAAGIALIIVRTGLPAFNALSGKSLSLWRFGLFNSLATLALFSVLIGIISGLYPALFLSRFAVIPALKGKVGARFSGILLRKSLVTFQFVIAIILIAGSMLIYQQLHYVLHRDLGFNKNQVLSMHLQNHELRNRIPALKERLLQNPLIEAVASASNPIGNNNIGSNGYFFEQSGQIATTSTTVQNFMIDPDYLHTMQIKLAAGRNFSEAFPADQFNSVMVNETLVKQLGWKDPIGKKVQYFKSQNGDRGEAIVIGVVKDFNIYSLQHKIEPLLLTMPPVDNEKDNLYVRISKANTSAGIRYLEQTFRQFDSSNPFEYHFLDQNFADQYVAEQKQEKILFVFTTLAIVIACLGLFGLISFTAEQRTKEIGVRKVLGASIKDIVVLLSKDFLKLVTVAALVSFPIAWFAMNKWLEDFAYKVNIRWWIFAIAGLIAVIIALITLCFRGISAAMANPVKSLRSE